MQPEQDWRRSIYRASRLDEFRKYLAGEHFDGSEYTPADFARMMTTHQQSAAMDAGTAVHAVLENAAFGDLPAHTDANGWHVHFDLDAELAFPAGREIPLQRTHKGIVLFGRVDAMDAHSVHDAKTTKAIDIDRYLDSYQWRGYLWLSGRKTFVYDLFKVKVEEDINVVTVQEYMPLKLSAYPGMDSDVEALLVEFDAAVRSLGIDAMMQHGIAA